MGFFEFDSESLEATAPPARSSSSARRPASGGTASAAAKSAARPSPRPTSVASPSSAPAASSPAPSPRPTAATSSTARRGGFGFSQLTPYLQQGLNLAQFGTQIAQQFGGARGAPSIGGQPAPAAPGPADASIAAAPTTTTPPGTDVVPPGVDMPPPQVGVPDAGAVASPSAPGAPPPPAVDQLSMLLQALQQRQIPPLPGTSPQMPASVPRMPGVAPPAAGLALLRSILTNPQLQQTLHLASSMGAAGPRAVSLPVPAVSQPRLQRPVEIPLGAVMNAIALLARQSMTELNASTREDEPEVPSYLVDEHGQYIVNPADATARASLVTHWFELSEQAELAEQAEQAEQGHADDAYEAYEADAEMDEWDEWAEDAGFTM